jgi:hypothetical protein
MRAGVRRGCGCRCSVGSVRSPRLHDVLGLGWHRQECLCYFGGAVISIAQIAAGRMYIDAR